MVLYILFTSFTGSVCNCLFVKDVILKKNDSLVIPTLSDYDNFTFKNKRDKNKNIVYVGTLNEKSKVIELAKNINKIVEETGNIKFQLYFYKLYIFLNC